jgi:hypothetical protein
MHVGCAVEIRRARKLSHQPERASALLVGIFFNFDCTSVRPAEFGRGEPGMAIRRGGFGRTEAFTPVYALIPHDRKQVVQRGYPAGERPLSCFRVYSSDASALPACALSLSTAHMRLILIC